MWGFLGGGEQLERGSLVLSSSSPTTLTTPGQYYKISGTFASVLNNNFTTDSNGKINYDGSGNIFQLVGVSDVKVNKASEVVYALFKNGTLVTGAETPHGFTASSKTENIAIAALLDISENDYYEVYAKSDVAVTILTAETLFLTFTRS